VFGAGGGTSSYREIEETDVILLWGSNARETHPIFFHHILKAVRRGARLYVVDPRRTTSADWADGWLGLEVGTDISLANGVARVILEKGLENRAFIDRATEHFDEYRASVQAYDLDRVSRETGVPADLIERMAVDYASSDRAQICWTLGITEHHNAVDNVLALINLGVLTGHVGRYGCGLNPLRGQNNVQGGGDMGALPAKLTGFQDVEDPVVRAKFERAWGGGVKIPPKNGWHLTEMFEAMGHGELTALYVLGENPAQSEADSALTLERLKKLEFLVVQDIFRTGTAELADVVFPASASWCETEGTVTSSERRVQRVRKAVSAPGNARDDIAILCELSRRLGHDIGNPTPEQVWDELRTVSPMHGGMSYARLEAMGGIHWPCPDENHPGSQYLHGRLWEEPVQGMKAPFVPVEQVPPVDKLDRDFPFRLTTGRRLDSFNTGVQTSGFDSPMRRGETLDLCPEDAAQLEVVEGEQVRVSSRRGSLVAPVRLDRGLRPGLAFMTMHFPDEIDTNVLTIDATDPKSGTAEFKASAIRIEKLAEDPAAAK
jgi:predicted molibdopterin-dependent oxidoreductase YjgC